MADEGITFKTFGSEGAAPTTGGDQGPPLLSSSFAERAAAIKRRMAGGDQGGGTPPSVGPTVDNAATLHNLSNGRAEQSDIPASEYAKMSWGEYAPKVAANLLPSTWEAVKGMGNAVAHPIDTASALGQIGTGLGSKALDAAGEAVGYGPVLDPSKKAEREKIVDALGQSYASRYGFGEKEGEFWKNLAEDPASYLSDIASVATGGEGALSKLGVIDKAGKVAKTAQLAGKLDPIQAAVAATGKVAPVVGKAVPYGLMTAQSMIGGVPFQDLKMARQIALSGDPEKMRAFTSALRGKKNFSGDAADAYENALMERMDKASNDYMTDRATAFARTQPVDIAKAIPVRDELNNMVNPYSSTYGKLKSPYSPEDTLAAQEAINTIDNILTHPTAVHTIESLDQIKKSISTIAKYRIKNPTLKSRVYAVAGELVDAMDKTDPAYGRMMKTWSDALDDVRKARSEIGTSAASDVTKAKRIRKSIQNNSRIFDTLENTPSGKNLREGIAGNALNEWGSPRMGHIFSGIGGLGGALWAMGHNPATVVGAVPALGLASPRLGGELQYGLGRAERLVNRPVDALTSDLTSSPVLNNVMSQYGAAREGRKSGGRVSSHDTDADQLVKAAERAKKGWSAQTEPLLNQSDEAVANALEVANRSI